MQLGFYCDQSRCIGCYTCVVACKDWHDIPAGPVSWRRVKVDEEGRFPNVTVTFLSISCNHCVTPSCVPACPEDAIVKRESDGVVIIIADECTGCRACEDSCPYHSIQFEDAEDAKAEKCDFCLERLEQGESPICVHACPQRALGAGPLEELQRSHGRINTFKDLPQPQTNPSLVVKPKRTSQA